MQWNDGADAGFSPAGVKTWLPIPPSYSTINVTSEQNEQDSMLHWYQQIIALKSRIRRFMMARRPCSTPATGTCSPGCANRTTERRSWSPAISAISRRPSASICQGREFTDECEDADENPRRDRPGFARIDSARGVRRVHRPGAVRITRSRDSRRVGGPGSSSPRGNAGSGAAAVTAPAM